jgi:hypothetical protein
LTLHDGRCRRRRLETARDESQRLRDCWPASLLGDSERRPLSTVASRDISTSAQQTLDALFAAESRGDEECSVTVRVDHLSVGPRTQQETHAVEPVHLGSVQQCRHALVVLLLRVCTGIQQCLQTLWVSMDGSTREWRTAERTLQLNVSSTVNQYTHNLVPSSRRGRAQRSHSKLPTNIRVHTTLHQHSNLRNITTFRCVNECRHRAPTAIVRAGAVR